jgi:cytoskeletal protein CcmA (bactofilin family)
MKKTEQDIQMLGPRSVVEGNIVFEGTLFLNGHVKGSIESRDGSVVIGEDAVIHADVFVRKATIKGEIKGSVHATEVLELLPPARVYGDINAPVLQMDAGVIFEGTCAIESKEKTASQTDQVPSTKHGESSKNDEISPEDKGAIPLRKNNKLNLNS